MSANLEIVATAPRRVATTIHCVEPATRAPLGDVAIDAPSTIASRVSRGRAAQHAWASTSFAERRRLLRALLSEVLQHADELCDVAIRNAGKTRENAMLGEIWPVCEKLRWTIRHGEKHLRSERISSGLFVHKRAVIEYRPRGVVGVISPWNYPVQNIFGPTIAALMAGNAVVIKASEWVAAASPRLQSIFDAALDSVGQSRDLVQIINGYADTGSALVSAGVDLVIFTGSMANGKKVLAQSASTLTPVILELGGKDALIVCDDAHIEQALHAAMAGVFIAAGQNCLAAERILVFDAVYERFAARIVDMVRGLRQGPPSRESVVDVGSMTTPLQLQTVQRLVDDAVRRGARVLVGGKRVLSEQGEYFAPTVLCDVDPNADILKEETFGPVMVLVRVGDEAEAIRVANSTMFGLSCTVMTKSRRRAARMAAQIVAGSTSINDFGLTYMVQGLPFGGVAGSGFGRLNGREGLRACTDIKAVLSDRWPLYAPARLYPVRPATYGVARGIIRGLYAPQWKTKLQGVGDVVRGLRRHS